VARHDKTNDLEFYPTPRCAGYHVWEYIPRDMSGWDFLEPSAGSGNLVDIVKFISRPRTTTLVDMSAERTKILASAYPDVNVIQGDFLQINRFDKFLSGDKRLVFMNPPFSAAIKHIEKAITLASMEPVDKWNVVALAPLSLQCQTTAYKKIFQDHTPDIIPLVGRASFSGDGGMGKRDTCWYVFGNGTDNNVDIRTWRPIR